MQSYQGGSVQCRQEGERFTCLRFTGGSPGTTGAAFYRLQLPFTYLRARGHNVTVSLNLPQGDSSVVVAQRTANPHASRLFQHLARNTNTKCIYEIDDNVFEIEAHSAAHDGWSYVDDLISVEANAAVAHAVTVSTPKLGSVFGGLNDNLYVLPNTVPATLLSREKRVRPGKDNLRIGWGGSATHAEDWAPYAAAIARVVEKSYSSLCVTGPTYVESPSVVQEPWCELVPDWWKRVETFDVGLAPLVDSEFNRSKSFIKILEYASLGVPFICSPVGPYAEHVIDGVNGLFARTPEEWADLLDKLIRSPWLRSQLADRARGWADLWTTETHIRKWEEVYLNG